VAARSIIQRVPSRGSGKSWRLDRAIPTLTTVLLTRTTRSIRTHGARS